MKENIYKLEKHLPENTIELLLPLMQIPNLVLVISKPRVTKKGDYWPPVKSSTHKISVNGDLNKYAFLITLLHELAHLNCWNKFQNKISAHGLEWQTEFKWLLNIFLNKDIFPDDLKKTIKENLIDRVRFSGNYKQKLEYVLEKYNDYSILRLKDLTDNVMFELLNGRKFKILKKVRTRYLCQDIVNKKQYLISSMSAIKSVI